MKYYAVKKGFSKGVFLDETEFRKQIDGFSNPVYQVFDDYNEAIAFLVETKEKEAVAYIDGSFDINKKKYSFGGVLIIDGHLQVFKKAFSDPEYLQYRNVAGEVRGGAYIISYCHKIGIKKLTLYYDYEGIHSWYERLWKANTPLTMKYQEFASSMKGKISVSFVHIKSHSKNELNDLADKLAKEALTEDTREED